MTENKITFEIKNIVNLNEDGLKLLDDFKENVVNKVLILTYEDAKYLIKKHFGNILKEVDIYGEGPEYKICIEF